MPVYVSSLQPDSMFQEKSLQPMTVGLGTEAVYWDSFTRLFYFTEKEKNFLPVHQVISSDIFEIHKNFKMLNKRTFIFKLYSPKCVYEIVFLRAYSMLCKITFYLVVYYYSTRNPVACIFYFKLIFLVICAFCL